MGRPSVVRSDRRMEAAPTLVPVRVGLVPESWPGYNASQFKSHTGSDMEGAGKESRYRLLKKLGRGGMGEVFLAEDTVLRRKVALKFVRDGDDLDTESEKRILREARAAAALDHPFICHIHDVGEMDDRPFIAMEYVQGQTLKEKLTGSLLPLEGSPADRPGDSRGTGRGPQSQDHPSGCQAGEHPFDRTGPCEDHGLRVGEVDQKGGGRRTGLHRQPDGRSLGPGNDSLHVTGAGHGERGGSTQ